MTQRKRRSSLVSQQKRLLSHLDALSKTVAELEADMGAQFARASRRRKAASALGALAAVKQKFKFRMGRKQRKAWPSDAEDAIESNDR